MQKGSEHECLNKQKKFHFDNLYMDNPQTYESIILYQIGDLSCEGGYSIGDHEQYCYEISYVVSGSGYYYTDGKPYAVREGDIYLSLPGEHHDGLANANDPFRFFYVGFNFNTQSDETHPILHIKKMFHHVDKPYIADKLGIQVPFISIFNELINLNEYSSLMIKTYLYQIIVLAYRNFFSNWEKEYAPKNNIVETKQIVYQAVNYIDSKLEKITELTQIAVELDYSYSHLSHMFSREIGLTIKEYYDRKRFEKAVELLKNSDLSITRIAEMLQYQSIHTFSKAFRKKFGISPTEYQDLCIIEKNEQQVSIKG